jgi:5'-nucleotidase
MADVPAWAVEAHPAYIVHVAGRGWLDPEPDLVLSGINIGANVGHAVLHSGTIGAALTAARHGWRALAVSLETAWPPPEQLHGDTATAVPTPLLDGLVAAPAGDRADAAARASRRVRAAGPGVATDVRRPRSHPSRRRRTGSVPDVAEVRQSDRS